MISAIIVTAIIVNRSPSVTKASTLSSVARRHLTNQQKQACGFSPRPLDPGPEPLWLFLRVNSLLGGKGSHSDMDVVLEVSLVKDPAKPWS